MLKNQSGDQLSFARVVLCDNQPQSPATEKVSIYLRKYQLAGWFLRPRPGSVASAGPARLSAAMWRSERAGLLHIHGSWLALKWGNSCLSSRTWWWQIPRERERKGARPLEPSLSSHSVDWSKGTKPAQIQGVATGPPHLWEELKSPMAKGLGTGKHEE